MELPSLIPQYVAVCHYGPRPVRLLARQGAFPPFAQPHMAARRRAEAVRSETPPTTIVEFSPPVIAEETAQTEQSKWNRGIRRLSKGGKGAPLRENSYLVRTKSINDRALKNQTWLFCSLFNQG